MYQYWGFGLRIVSEIEFPELLAINTIESDITIYIGKTPANIDGLQIEGNLFTYTISNTELLLKVKDIASYYASNGHSITVEMNEAVSEMRSVRLYLLATVMAAVLLQRKLLPLHAAAILQPEGLCLIAGDSGAGKSTAIAGLLKKGYAVFSDDVVVLNIHKEIVTVAASYPMMKLWEDTLTKLDHAVFSKRDFEIKPGMDKYGIFFHEQFDTAQYPVKKMILLKKGKEGQLTSRKITGAGIFKELIGQIYRPLLLQDPGLKILVFQLFSSLMQTVEVYEIIRPENCIPEDLISHIENLLHNA